MMELRDNEPTVRVVTEGENRGWRFLSDTAAFPLTKTITGVRDFRTADGNDVRIVITALVGVNNEETVFRAWRDSGERPNSPEEADENLLNLVSGHCAEAISHATLEDLKNGCIGQGAFSGADEKTSSALREDGLALLGMRILLRLPDKVLYDFQ